MLERDVSTPDANKIPRNVPDFVRHGSVNLDTASSELWRANPPRGALTTLHFGSPGELKARSPGPHVGLSDLVPHPFSSVMAAAAAAPTAAARLFLLQSTPSANPSNSASAQAQALRAPSPRLALSRRMAGGPPAAIAGASGGSERDLSASALSMEAQESVVASDSGAFLGPPRLGWPSLWGNGDYLRAMSS